MRELLFFWPRHDDIKLRGASRRRIMSKSTSLIGQKYRPTIREIIKRSTAIFRHPRLRAQRIHLTPGRRRQQDSDDAGNGDVASARYGPIKERAQRPV